MAISVNIAGGNGISENNQWRQRRNSIIARQAASQQPQRASGCSARRKQHISGSASALNDVMACKQHHISVNISALKQRGNNSCARDGGNRSLSASA